ncbi:MAG TPA: glycosyltransferase family 2 protein [Nitrospirota bacterium]|nr:glycosyltransferase family 2 protein [Nitrospirota bacterium]
MSSRISPKVSIVIPTFNRASYLPQAVESALAQDYQDLEVIVSDNASTDDTPDRAKNYAGNRRFRYFRNNNNIGCVPNYHRPVLEHATGNYYLILSDDDYLTDAGYISKAVKMIQTDPEIVMVYSQGHILNENTGEMIQLYLPFREIEDGKRVFLSRGTVRPMDFTHCNVLFNRDIALSFKPYENEWNLSCDSELFLLMCLRGKVGVVKDFVSVYRVHSTSMTSRIRKDPRLLINNLEYVLNPYRVALEQGTISMNDLRKWKERLLMPEVRSALLWCALYHQDASRDLIAALRDRYPSVIDEIMSGARFRFHYTIANASRALFWIISGAYRRELSRERRRARQPKEKRT